MKATDVTTLDFRHHMGELLNQVYYQAAQFRIKRKGKTMAWLVDDPFMQKMGQLVEHIIEHEPSLADSLTLTLDRDIRHVIEQGSQEVAEGKTIPIERMLDDE